VAPQGVAGELLQVRIQAGAQGLAGVLQQLAGQVGRQLGSGGLARALGAAEGVVHIGGEGLGVAALLFPAHFRQQAAGPAGHHGGGGIGGAQQGGGQGGFPLVQAVGPLAEQLLAHGADALQFAPEGHQVEIGLDDLALVPGAFETHGGGGLAELVEEGAAAPTLPVFFQQAGQLHGQGAGAPGTAAPEVAPGGLAGGAPVDALMLHEAPVFGDDDRPHQGRGNIRQGRPGPAPCSPVEAEALQHLPVPGQQGGVGAPVFPAHLGVVRQGQGGRCGQPQEQGQGGEQYPSPQRQATLPKA